jgi:hypothetical protein
VWLGVRFAREIDATNLPWLQWESMANMACFFCRAGGHRTASLLQKLSALAHSSLVANHESLWLPSPESIRSRSCRFVVNGHHYR